MRKLFCVLALSLSVLTSASAATLTDNFGGYVGPYVWTGTLFSSNPDATGNVNGIGTVNQITDGAGTTLWTAGQLGSFVSFIYDGFVVNYNGPIDPITGASTYTEINGKVDFYQSLSNIFSATGNWATDSANIITNSDPAFVTLDGVLTAGNYSVYGTIGPINVDGHGALNVTGGTKGSAFDTNAILWQNVVADMSFDYSGTSLNAQGYAYSGSVTAKGELASVPVPEPAGLMLLGIGCIGLATFSRPKGFANQSLAA